jgi:hypothetical protein
MGASYSFSSVLAEATKEDIAAAVASLGAAFEPFSAAIVDNCVEGEDIVDDDADLQVRLLRSFVVEILRACFFFCLCRTEYNLCCSI